MGFRSNTKSIIRLITRSARRQLSIRIDKEKGLR